MSKTIAALAKIVAANLSDDDLLAICLQAGDDTEISPFEEALRREYEKRHPEDFDMPILDDRPDDDLPPTLRNS